MESFFSATSQGAFEWAQKYPFNWGFGFFLGRCRGLWSGLRRRIQFDDWGFVWRVFFSAGAGGFLSEAHQSEEFSLINWGFGFSAPYFFSCYFVLFRLGTTDFLVGVVGWGG